MSNEENKEVLDPQNNNDGSKDEANDFVSKKAYGEVSADMHRYKGELKDMKAQLNQLQAEKEATKNEALAEQGRWEELYKGSQTNLDQLKSEREDESKKFIDFHKKNSVLQKLGGFKRDEYNSFINTESISLNDDGSVNEDSVMTEMDRIKQQYPELINIGSGSKLPNEAPAQQTIGDTNYNELDSHQQNDFMKNLLKGR